MNGNFETKLFKGFVVPGIILEAILLLNIFLPESISLFGVGLLKHTIHGPAVLVVDMATLPAIVLFCSFLLIAAVYAFVLVYRYRSKSPKFVPTARIFLIIGNVSITLLTVALLCFVGIAIANDYEMLNLPVVVAYLVAMVGALVFFYRWTRSVYTHEGLTLLCRTSFKSLGKAVGFTLLGIVAVIAISILVIFLGDLFYSHFPIR